MDAIGVASLVIAVIGVVAAVVVVPEIRRLLRLDYAKDQDALDFGISIRDFTPRYINSRHIAYYLWGSEDPKQEASFHQHLLANLALQSPLLQQSPAFLEAMNYVKGEIPSPQLLATYVGLSIAEGAIGLSKIIINIQLHIRNKSDREIGLSLLNTTLSKWYICRHNNAKYFVNLQLLLNSSDVQVIQPKAILSNSATIILSPQESSTRSICFADTGFDILSSRQHFFKAIRKTRTINVPVRYTNPLIKKIITRNITVDIETYVGKLQIRDIDMVKLRAKYKIMYNLLQEEATRKALQRDE